MVRLGGPQGRVGVVGTEAGLSVNREHVKGLAGGRDATEPTTDALRHGEQARARPCSKGSARRADATAASATTAPGAAKQGGRADAAATGGRVQGVAAVRIPGSSLDLTGNAEDGQHEFVRYASPPPVDVATLHTAAGRVFGAGGT